MARMGGLPKPKGLDMLANRLRIPSLTLLSLALLVPLVAPAQAGTDILVRQLSPSFDACVAVQDQMMRNLGADPADLLIEMHTGAVLERRYPTSKADLVLVCNRVTDTLEVRRVTPGSAVIVAQEL